VQGGTELCRVVHTCNPAFKRLRKEDIEFQASLGYIVSMRKGERSGGRERGRKKGMAD
jgi:hypothetical protein